MHPSPSNQASSPMLFFILPLYAIGKAFRTFPYNQFHPVTSRSGGIWEDGIHRPGSYLCPPYDHRLSRKEFSTGIKAVPGTKHWNKEPPHKEGAVALTHKKYHNSCILRTSDHCARNGLMSASTLVLDSGSSKASDAASSLILNPLMSTICTPAWTVFCSPP
jgi:hypothetical protein